MNILKALENSLLALNSIYAKLFHMLNAIAVADLVLLYLKCVDIGFYCQQMCNNADLHLSERVYTSGQNKFLPITNQNKYLKNSPLCLSQSHLAIRVKNSNFEYIKQTLSRFSEGIIQSRFLSTRSFLSFFLFLLL